MSCLRSVSGYLGKKVKNCKRAFGFRLKIGKITSLNVEMCEIRGLNVEMRDIRSLNVKMCDFAH